MRLRVMVVEDDPLHRKLYEAWLSGSGFQAIMVPDERTAEAAAVQQMPDLAIIDLRLPHLSGLEVIKALRGAEAVEGIPILAVSVLSDRQDEEASLAAGADRFVRKPVSLRKLTRIIVDLTGGDEPSHVASREDDRVRLVEQAD